MTQDNDDTNSTAIATQSANDGLAPVRGTDDEMQKAYGLTASDVAVLKSTVCIGAPMAMVAFFMKFCSRRGLDPFARHVYLMKTIEYGEDKWNIVSGIDGLRTIASRNPLFRGIGRPTWTFEYNDDGTVKRFEAGDSKYKHIAGKRRVEECEVEVYRAVKSADRDKREYITFYGVIRFDEYVQRARDTGKIQGNWEKQPENQSAVRAEAQALRKAFPEDVGSIYTEDEMRDQQREGAALPPLPVESTVDPTEDDQEIEALAKTLKWQPAMVHAQLHARNGDKEVLLTFMRGEIEKRQSMHAARQETATVDESPTDKLATKASRGRLMALLASKGIDRSNKSARLAIAQMAGVQVGSYTELSEQDVEKIQRFAEQYVDLTGFIAAQNEPVDAEFVDDNRQEPLL